MIGVILLHLRLDDEWRPHLAAAVGELEILGHHADHLERFVIEHDPFADDLRIAAEARLPEGMSEHDDLRVPFLVLAATESPPQLRLRAERVEEGSRDPIARVTFRATFAGQGVIAIAHDDHFLQRLRLLAERDHIARRHRSARDPSFLLALEENHQSFLVWKRKRPQHSRVRRAEDSRDGADAQRDGENGNQCESRLLQQYSRAVAQVLPESVHGFLPSDSDPPAAPSVASFGLTLASTRGTDFGFQLAIQME